MVCKRWIEAVQWCWPAHWSPRCWRIKWLLWGWVTHTGLSIKVFRCTCMLSSINAILTPSYSFLIRPQQPQGLIMEMYCRFLSRPPCGNVVWCLKKEDEHANRFEAFLWWFKNRAVFHSPTVRAQPRALCEPAITTHDRAAAVMRQAISRAPTAAISPVAYLSLLSFFSSSSISLFLCLSFVFFSPVPSSFSESFSLCMSFIKRHRSFLVTRFYEGRGN